MGQQTPATSFPVVDAFAILAGDNSAAPGMYAQALKNLATGFEPQRTPGIFKHVTFGNGGTVWTPAANKRFRLMAYIISLTQNAVQTSAGVITLNFQDGGVNIGHGASVFVPTAAVSSASDWVRAFVIPFNGYLSTAINNALSVIQSVALTAGTFDVCSIGTEE